MDYEKLGAFYLGKEYSLEKQQLLDRLVMYDSRDLTTHAICIGMTGSGKTGLCVDLLEEAAIDGVPAIIIDPKGDITNRLLMFPDLAPGDFLPWVNPDDARRKGLSIEDFAAKQAESWKSGLSSWGQDGERIRTLRDSADLVIYTPGSDAGVPVSVIQSFAAPDLSWDTEAELIREKISGTATALLALIRLDADPLVSREHILISSIFEHFWRKGEDLDLVTLIRAIQNPPLAQVGAFDIETFFPAKERTPLAMRLNHIIAAPSFRSWMEGQPLDIPGFLATPDGKTRHSIFYIAHLNEEERMFFVTLLLYQVLSWIRTQSGTTSLRALLYMDEIFGFFPPTANPPSKEPMLTLLKQARAFGLGVVLTTQNPVDLDYKGLSNTGTWFIGRLQTKQDRDRVLDGLEGAVQGGGFSRADLSDILSSLDSRVFLLHNVHEDAPVIFSTRWAMSYLRGPLSREQVRTLMDGRRPDTSGSATRSSPATSAGESTGTPPEASPAGAAGILPLVQASALPPTLPADISQRYLPVRITREAAEADALLKGGGKVAQSSAVYEPMILAGGRIRYRSSKLEEDAEREFSLLAPFSSAGQVAWESARHFPGTPDTLPSSPSPDAGYSAPPDVVRALKKSSSLKKGLVDHLAHTRELKLYTSPDAGLVSKPGEPENEFLLRARLAMREKRDAEVDDLRKKHEAKVEKLEERLRKAGMKADKKVEDAEARKRETLISAGESVLGALLGRKSSRSVSTAAGKYRQSRSATMTAREAEETVRALEEDIKELKEEFEDEAAEIRARWENAANEIGNIAIKPTKTGISVTSFLLCWVPRWTVIVSDGTGTTKAERIDASGHVPV